MLIIVINNNVEFNNNGNNNKYRRYKIKWTEDVKLDNNIV